MNAKDDGTVRLFLNGVNITSSTSAPIFIKNARKTVVSLMENTKNTLSDSFNYVYENEDDDEPHAPLFSKDDLTINGTGTLIINGHYNDGIVSKDNLKIMSGNFQITSFDDGIVGRDQLAIKNGNFYISSGGDGLKSSNDKDENKGSITIENGTFNISARNDGIQAVNNLLIEDGTYKISTGGDNLNLGEAADKGMIFNQKLMPPPNSDGKDQNASDSSKGLKAKKELAILGGTFTIRSQDDALHSNQFITIADGNFSLNSEDDAIHADETVHIKNGNIHIESSYEGIESNIITIDGGTIRLTAQDDGINIRGGNDGSGRDYFGSTNNEDGYLKINDGTIIVNAEGDGIDSNGSIYMSGGTVVISGPTGDWNGALDYDGTFEIEGGFLVAAGSSGMAMVPSDSSSQHSIGMIYPSIQVANTIAHLEDRKGNRIATFAPEKDYQSIVISSPQLKKDETYTLYSGGTNSGKQTNGLYTDGDYKGGIKVVEFTLSKISTWLDETGETEGRKGRFPRRGGFNRDGAPPPQRPNS